MSSKAAEAMLERLKGNPWLPPYEEEGMKKVAKECNALSDLIEEVKRTYADDLKNPSVASAVVVHVTSIQRNKRCALAYLTHRLNKIKDLYWETTEMEFHDGYTDLMNDYMRDVGCPRLASDAVAPPKQLYVSVRVVKEPESAAGAGAAAAGGGAAAAPAAAAAAQTLFTDTGVVTLKRNTTHFLRRSDADLLVRQGVLQHVVD